MIRVVLDTNVLLVSVSERSRTHWLFNAFKTQKFELSFTTEILAEYEEQLRWHWNESVTEITLASILEAPNAVAVTAYYSLNLISQDPDDNKFVDCAFACNADYSVTDDHHFDVLKKIAFPLIHVVSIEDFKKILSAQNLLSP